jgi:hypothetical protein
VHPTPVLQVANDDVYYITPIVSLQNLMTPPLCTQTLLGNCIGGDGGTVDGTEVLHPMMQPGPKLVNDRKKTNLKHKNLGKYKTFLVHYKKIEEAIGTPTSLETGTMTIQFL